MPRNQEKRLPGRPTIGDQPMTNAERQRLKRLRQRAREEQMSPEEMLYQALRETPFHLLESAYERIKREQANL